MTDDERKLFEARLEAAKLAEARIRRLKEAIGNVADKKATAIALGLHEDIAPLQWCRSTEKLRDFQIVCWEENEEGLTAELRQAVLDILGKRLAEAERQLVEA